MKRQHEEELHSGLNDLLLLHIASDKFILTRFGLRRVRFYTLRHLYQNPGITISRLSELSFADAASTSRMVFSLEKDGLVQRQLKKEDRRKFLLSLTDAGEDLYEKANAELTADIKKRFGTIDKTQLQSILQHTMKLVDTLSHHRA